MATTSTPPSAAPIPLRMRHDLRFSAQRIRGNGYWCVKDPISLEYFHLKDEEFAILKMLDGRTSAAEIVDRFRARFAPLRVTVGQLGAFLQMLLANRLVVSDQPDSEAALVERFEQTRRRQRLRSLSNILAIRFNGVDPDRFLGWLHNRVAWLLRPWSLTMGLALVVAAITIAATRFDRLRDSIPQIAEFLTVENVVVLAAALAIVKVLHELAHGVICKHYGGECHELGVLLLVFTPCLYCDVSDSWMFPSKWQRIAVASAGIAMEILLASIATVLWSLSQPGFVQTLCLNVVLVASVNTLLFNGNVLRRYDGYYIFSDFAELPNLSQRASIVFRRTLGRVLLGVEGPQNHNAREESRGLLLLYAIASTIYLSFLIVMILWFCHRMLKPHGLGALADLVTVSTVLGIVVPTAVGTTKYVRDSARQHRIKKSRAMGSLVAFAIVAVLIAIVPWPFQIQAPATVQPYEGRMVHVALGGTLREAVPSGSAVEQNQVIAVLENPELQKDVARLKGELRETGKQLTGLQARRLNDPTVAQQIPAVKESLKDIQQQLSQRLRDQDELTLRAPVAGTVLPPPYRAQWLAGAEGLSTWSGYPLEARNRGCFLEPGTMLCVVGSPEKLEAILLVDETQIAFVEKGQEVKLQFDEQPGEIFRGTVHEISADNTTIAPRELAFGKKVATGSDQTGQTRLLQNAYQVRVTFTDIAPDLVRIRTAGRARISGSKQTLAERFYRYLHHAFGMM